MCLNKVHLPNGQVVRCQKCWQCIRLKIDDWTGRCIAESQTAAGCHSVTLTYGRDDRYDAIDHVRAAVLTYSDVQKCLKRIRKSGLKVRYFLVGEYGSAKGRAHWHCLFFWQNGVPIMPEKVPTEWSHWDHGHTYWDRLTPESVRYVTKYIAKESFTEERAYHMGLSRMPPLGDAYFRQLAQTYIEARLAPQDWSYSFAGVEKKGQQQRFQIRGVSRANFMRYFRDGWWARWRDHPPNSEILEEWEDREAAAGSQESAKRILAAEKAGAATLRDSVLVEASTYRVPKPKLHQLRSWMQPQRLQFSELLNVWMYVFDGEQRPWYWAKDEEGDWGWRAKIGVSAKNDASASYREASRAS